MKNMIKIFTVAMVVTSVSFAQGKKQIKKSMPAQTMSTPSNYTSSSYSSVDNEVTGLIGFTAGAFNAGVNYARVNDGFGYGGYFYYQGNKEKDSVPVVTSFMSFGGLIKLDVYERNNFKAYVAPGFGITMVKDGSINATTGKKSDETVIGPMWKLGAQYKVSNEIAVGLERNQFANWFNDGLNYVAPIAEYYSVSASFVF